MWTIQIPDMSGIWNPTVSVNLSGDTKEQPVSNEVFELEAVQKPIRDYYLVRQSVDKPQLELTLSVLDLGEA